MHFKDTVVVESGLKISRIGTSGVQNVQNDVINSRRKGGVIPGRVIPGKGRGNSRRVIPGKGWGVDKTKGSKDTDNSRKGAGFSKMPTIVLTGELPKFTSPNNFSNFNVHRAAFRGYRGYL